MDPWNAFLGTLSCKEARVCAEEIVHKAGTTDGSWEIFRAAAELLAEARGVRNRQPEWAGYPQAEEY